MSPKDKNEKEKESENENDETLMSSKDNDDDENENDKTLMSSNEDDDDETINQNEKNKIIKEKKWYFRWNNWQIKIIWRANKIVKKVRRSKSVLAL